MAGALDIQDMEELNSASDSEINQFTESDMLDSDDDTIVADNSGMSTLDLPPHLMSKRLKRRIGTKLTMNMVIIMTI